MTKIPVLSKSRIKAGFQCPKRLHFDLYRPEIKVLYSAADHANFAEGHAVGDCARREFPGGILIDVPGQDQEGAVAATRAAINQGALTIFEAGFIADGIHVRVDVLHRESVTAKWTLIEVKKSSFRRGDDVDPVYVEDISIQAIALKAAGLDVERYLLMCLNHDYVYPSPSGLFVKVDVMKEVSAAMVELVPRIEHLANLAPVFDPASIDIGLHCDVPYECPYQTECQGPSGLPEVFDLPGVGPKVGWSLVNRGFTRIDQLTPGEFSKNTERAIQVVKTGTPMIDHAAVYAAVTSWHWPLYFLDFETVAPALPRYVDCRPYAEIPIQFSCHVWRTPDSPVEHFEYLHLDTSDPREPLARALIEGIGDAGSVVAYHAETEARLIRSLGAHLPAQMALLNAITTRLVDPLPVFRKHVYYAEFRGKFSIKNVAPVLAGPDFDYKRLKVSDGLQARAIVEGLIAGSFSASERDELITALLAYCRQDTIAMVALTKWMLALNDQN